MRRTLALVATVAVVLGLVVSMALAADEKLFVRNQEFTKLSVENGVWWVHLDEFLKAAGIAKRFVTVGGVVDGQVNVKYNRRDFNVKADNRADGIWVDGRAFAIQMGGSWQPNALGFIDAGLPGPLVSIRPPAPPPPAGTDTPGGTAPPGTTPPADGKSPLKIETFEYANPQLPGNQALATVRGKVVIRNTAPEPLEAVKIIVHIEDGYEKDLDKLEQTVGTLDGGRSYTYEWTWQNYNSAFINPLVEVQHTKYMTNEEKDKLAKEGKTPPAEKPVVVKSRPTAGVPSASPTLGGPASSTNTSTVAPPGYGPGPGVSPTSTGTTTPSGPPGY